MEFRKKFLQARQCDPDRWNANAGRCYGTKEEVKSLNAFLDTLQTKVYEARRQLLEKNESITAESIKEHSERKNENQE